MGLLSQGGGGCHRLLDRGCRLLPFPTFRQTSSRCQKDRIFEKCTVTGKRDNIKRKFENPLFHTFGLCLGGYNLDVSCPFSSLHPCL